MAALLYYFLSAREDTEEKVVQGGEGDSWPFEQVWPSDLLLQMKAIASSTLRMAAEAIFRGSSDNENEAEAAAEVKINSAIAGNKSTPLTIPKAEDEAITASFSAMSIDTVASSVATTEAFSEVATSSSIVSNTDEANDVENIPIINMAEVREHCDPNDGWMVIYDRVYDVTDFLMEVWTKRELFFCSF